ncbi:hypothetical protein [Nocardioides solisilvae]|uniref:hypothetical protein n=1 Tax=Nocardioides solisilvae TaxID=1542435 RepID=UPI000D748E86|nr:hypothetical protein [Nocardioides solisilvae]
MRNSVLRRVAATGASLAVASVGLAAFAPSATAASGEMTFNCKLLNGFSSADFTTVADTDLPASVQLGSSTPVNFTATITIPEATANLARNFGSTVEGKAAIATTINDAAAPASVTLPATSTGTSGPLVLSVAGTADAAYVADSAGKKTVKLTGYNADLVFKNAAGTATPVDAKCTAAPTADTTVDTFDVIDPNAPAVQATETTATTKYKKKQAKLVAKVEVLNEDGSAAAGDVKMVLKKGKKKAKASVTLNKKGKGKNAFTKVAPGKYKLVVKYKGSETSKKSKETLTVKVK